MISGNSNESNVINLVKKFKPFDLIFIDGSHEYKDVKKDLQTYSKMLSENGILVAHDIHQEDRGVKKAWSEFKSSTNYEYKEIFYKKSFFHCGVGIARKK